MQSNSNNYSAYFIALLSVFFQLLNILEFREFYIIKLHHRQINAIDKKIKQYCESILYFYFMTMSYSVKKCIVPLSFLIRTL